MKKNYIKSCIAMLCLLFTNIIFAQNDTILVTQGLGTLEEAIKSHKGDVVYKLKAGAWYGLTSIVEVSDATMGPGKGLVIVGEKTNGMPAVIQVGNDGGGAVFNSLFNAFNDLTLKNVFLVAQDFSGAGGANVITISNKINLVVDKVVMDPAGLNYTFAGGRPSYESKAWVTNSLIIRNGNMGGPNDGGIFQDIVFDTLYFENNTIASSGQDFLGAGFHPNPNHKFLWINHNSFFWHDVWLKKSYNDNALYMTNNLFHDISIFAQLYAWGQFFPDYMQGNEMLSQLAADTLELADGTNETLPSSRISFWQRNLQYNSEGLRSLPKYARDNKLTPIYSIPFVWDENTPQYYASDAPVTDLVKKSRENRIFNDDVNFPNFKFNHCSYDIDPGYIDKKIYDISDNVGEHIIGWFSKLIWGVPGAPEVNDLPSYNWDIDLWSGTKPEDYPVVWPRFNGAYTNPDLLKASTEGLPLGDLNWFPNEKAKWEANKDEIMKHILSLNEDQFTITGINILTENGSFRMFPNPVTNELRIESKDMLSIINVYNIGGQMVKSKTVNSTTATIDFSDVINGVYLIKAKNIKGVTNTYKLIKE